MDYCGLCKSTGKCHYCSNGACLASDPCKCGAVKAGSSGSSGTGSSGSSGTGTGVPCSQGTHPAWQGSECVTTTTCGTCTMKTCTRVANGGCCSGYDLGWIFIPCANSCGGDCTAAAKDALQKCGCNK